MDGKARVQWSNTCIWHGKIVRHEIEHQAPLKIVKIAILYHVFVLNSRSSLFERSLQVMFTVGRVAILFRKLLIGVVKCVCCWCVGP